MNAVQTFPRISPMNKGACSIDVWYESRWSGEQRARGMIARACGCFGHIPLGQPGDTHSPSQEHWPGWSLGNYFKSFPAHPWDNPVIRSCAELLGDSLGTPKPSQNHPNKHILDKLPVGFQQSCPISHHLSRSSSFLCSVLWISSP